MAKSMIGGRFDSGHRGGLYSFFGGVCHLQDGCTTPSLGSDLCLPQGFAHIFPIQKHITVGGSTDSGRTAPHFLQFLNSGKV
ncbi:MAG TPA: hypothetical protein VFC84_04145 [Desulfosporosinus sp.]|nr:hypothetical protein [Desulfosporosinus sp.]